MKMTKNEFWIGITSKMQLAKVGLIIKVNNRMLAK